MLKSKLLLAMFSLMLLMARVDLVFADHIKIAVAGPFSGPYVAAGDQQWQGALQAVEDINAEGGINGNKLLLIPFDDSCNANKAELVAKRIVQAGDIVAVIGHNCSAATLAAEKIYAAANILMITPASTTPEITEHDYELVFRTCGRDDVQGEIAAMFIVQKLKKKRVAIVNDGSVYGSVVATNTKKSLEYLGG